jgi:hypothetical protein
VEIVGQGYMWLLQNYAAKWSPQGTYCSHQCWRHPTNTRGSKAVHNYLEACQQLFDLVFYRINGSAVESEFSQINPLPPDDLCDLFKIVPSECPSVSWKHLLCPLDPLNCSLNCPLSNERKSTVMPYTVQQLRWMWTQAKVFHTWHFSNMNFSTIWAPITFKLFIFIKN